MGDNKMNYDTSKFFNAWFNQVAFLKDVSTFHDALIKSIKVDQQILIPYFSGLTGHSHFNIENLSSKIIGNGAEKTIAFIICNDQGNQTGEMLVELKSGANFLTASLFIPLAIDDSFNKLDFIQSFRSWVKNIAGLDITFNEGDDLRRSNSDASLDFVDENFSASSMILTAGPSISTLESFYAYDAASKGWNKEWSKYLDLFEKKFAEYIGVKYALATSSCTGALQIALMSLDIGPGDEVIVPDETWVATANAVRYVGATPVFADIELDSWNIDANSVESLITPNTKAIIAVHMYGHPARMSKIMEVAKKHGLRVVEDAAPAIGAEWEGKRCGSFGDLAAFSFQGAKLLVTGEGGMLVTNDDVLYQKAKKIWDQGRNPSRTFWIDADGVKFKMSNVQAALGLAQIERADELIEMKRRIFSWYQEGLKDTPFVTLNAEVSGARSIYWMSSLRLDESAPIGRDELIQKLKEVNVDTRPVFPAISQYPIWPRHQEPKPIAMRVGLQAMNLPSGVCLTKNEVMYVARQINRVLVG